MKKLNNLAELHNIRKQEMVYETKKELALNIWLQKATAHFDTPEIRRQAIKKFNQEYPPFKLCPIEGSKLSR